jgi:hydroxymethylpyrimidine pyrophosphatase-like HAD family hydrolase
MWYVSAMISELIFPMDAYLFDVDGVLTNPITKMVNPKLITLLGEKLQNGHLITFNTGRSISWLIEPLLLPLSQLVATAKLNNLLIIGEKGGAWMKGSQIYDGLVTLQDIKVQIDPLITIPSELQTAVRQLVDKSYADTMFYDESKLTMATIEMIDNTEMHLFEDQQKVLVKDLNKLLEEYGMVDQLNVDATRIATDIENIHSGKALGAQRMLDIFSEQAIKIEDHSYTCFGDSKSDIDMAIQLSHYKLPVSFIFVGGHDAFDATVISSYAFSFTTTAQHFDLGTLEFLEK